jgi:hypothetical protein
MTELDRLPPDQRAVLSLVLERGKSYAEVAELLAIPEGTVRDRAHAALDALANDVAAGGSRSAGLAPTRTGARGSSGASRPAARDASGAEPAGLAGSTRGVSGSSAAGSSAARTREPRATRTQASSRRAGALLLGAIVVVIVVAVILISSGGGKGSSPTTTAGKGTSSTSTTSTASTGKASLDSTIQLSSVEPTVHASGAAYVLSESGRRAFYVTAQGLPPSSGFFYAVWLYNSPSSSEPLGRASNVGSDGRMEGGNPLPTNAGDYAKFIVTRETSTHPTHPGPTVLSGSFSLH